MKCDNFSYNNYMHKNRCTTNSGEQKMVNLKSVFLVI